MKQTVKVTITRDENIVRVETSNGKRWEFLNVEDTQNDTSVTASVAAIASALITGTIATQLRKSNNPKLTYELIVEI